MPYTPGFRFDLFISYAHFDNEPGLDGVQWVSELHRHLRSALQQRIGRGADDLEIFFDPMLRANQRLPELLEAARKSAVFLAVGSRAWVTRKFTLQELEAFCTANPDSSRLFLVECLPLHSTEKYPKSLEHHLRMEFHRKLAGTPLPFSPVSDASRFREGVHRLAEQIGNELIELRGAEPQPPSIVGATPHSPRMANPKDAFTSRRGGEDASAASRSCVLIAQPTDDLYNETAQLDQFLRQYGVSTRIAGDFQQAGRDFTDAFEQGLVDCSLFVQLLGPYPGRHPADLPIGFTMYQAQAAQAAGVEILQWRRPNLDLSGLTDEAHAALLEGENVIISTLEEFKEAVLGAAKATPMPTEKRKPSSLVFIDADISDFDVARTIQKEFAAHRFPVAIPSRGEGESSEEVRLELEGFLVDSDVIIFLYGSTKPTWIKGQLRLYTKLRHKRETDPRLLAIYTGPPVDKEEIGFLIPDARELLCPESWTMEPIRGLIHELQP